MLSIGILTFVISAVTALALLFYIADRAISAGVLEILAAIRLRRGLEGEFPLLLAGFASVAFGVRLVLQPATGALAVIWLIAAYALALGVILVLPAFKARGFARMFAGS